MKVFISWSGDISGKVARILRDWLPHVIQSIQPYVSSEDIDKGTRWNTEISKELDTAFFGILCVTRDNINSPWLNFEAGALSRSLKSKSVNRVCPFLFGISPDDLKGPLQQFQAARYDKDDIKRLIFSLNAASGKARIKEDRLDDVFNVWWPKLYEQFEDVYKLIKKKIVWAFETKDLDATTEINLMATEGFGVSAKWFLGVDAPPGASQCDLLIYVYAKSVDSIARLNEVMAYLNSIPNVIPLIVYTRYAGGDGRLAEEELSVVRRYTKYVIANMPETLRDRLKGML
jgi:hypothetical protein